MEFLLILMFLIAGFALIHFQYKEDKNTEKILSKEDISKLEKSLSELDDMQKELLRVSRDQNVTKHS